MLIINTCLSNIFVKLIPGSFKLKQITFNFFGYLKLDFLDVYILYLL